MTVYLIKRFERGHIFVAKYVIFDTKIAENDIFVLFWHDDLKYRIKNQAIIIYYNRPDRDFKCRTFKSFMV